MIIWLYRQIQGIRKALAGRDRPEELAWAMSLGVLIGLVPKGNLVAIGLIVVMLALRINHAMAAVTAVAVSFGAVMLDPFTHQLGNWMLNVPALQNFYTWAWQQPVVPWTDLNNTVVVGSLMLGLISLFPVYSLTLPMFKSLAAKHKQKQAQPKPELMRPAPIAPLRSADLPEIRTDRPHLNVDVIRVQHSEAEVQRISSTRRGPTVHADNAKTNKQEDAA